MSETKAFWPETPAIRSLVKAFRQRFRRDPEVVVRAPGRVNLLGAHVDHSEGLVLPAAIDRAIWLAAGVTHEPRLAAVALDRKEEGALGLRQLPPPVASRKRPGSTWIDYPTGVAWALRSVGFLVPGVDVVFGGNVPVGAGVGSSAAVEVAFVLAWEALGRFVLPRNLRAQIGQRAENDYLDVRSGVMDQFASLYGARDHLVLLDCRSLEHELLPVRPGLAVVLADSGECRELTSSDFNQRREECHQALILLREQLPEARSLRDVTTRDLDRHAARLPPILAHRARHVVEECARVRAGARALREGDLTAFGDLIRQSHVSSRDLFESSSEELDTLAEAAWEQSGCYGARFVGGGFGGFVAALVEASAADVVSTAVADRFERRHGRRPETFTCRFDGGAEVWGAPARAPHSKK